MAQHLALRLTAASVAAAVIGFTPAPSHGTPTTCSGSATLDARVVVNPPTGAAAAEVAAWDVAVPPCARVLVYQIVDADTGKPVDREAVFPPHTVRHEQWEKHGDVMRLHLGLQNVGAALTCGQNCARKSERWTRRVRAVVRWFPQAPGA